MKAIALVKIPYLREDIILNNFYNFDTNNVLNLLNPNLSFNNKLIKESIYISTQKFKYSLI